MANLRENMLDAFIAYCEGNIEKTKIDIEVYLNNPVGIGEHPDIMEALEKKMQELAEYDELLSVAHQYFRPPV